MQVNTIFEQGTGIINEDFHFVDEDFFGVFDGATSLTADVYEDGQTGGFLASNIAGNTFKNNNDTLKNLAGKANHAICNAMLKNGVNLSDKKNLWSTSAAVVRLKGDHLEWVQIGDCLVLAIYEDGTHRLLTDNFNHDLETFELWQKIGHQTQAPIAHALKGQISKVRSKMNVTYGVLNGEKKALSFIRSGTEKLEGMKHFLIFTDGLFVPKKDPQKREDFAQFSELFQKGGLSHVRDVIRSLEQKDTDCRKYPRFKTHDDIAAISLSF